ncbi:Periplasmic zinc-binding protein TroA precursor [Pirellulimonas nuda]|uniref:Periplasmic zinc-binding protein TroA n=1 Tax=Pirellulimonas nuda TaxID=2528009 RepID=A0A518DER9_9BACT|nr:zinc ABC transporter substrate-binding protein [Pirellulimonas nuda]QDU89932.1 Periplasmic zinc-binding protein TroA precursor [Pirellulimonas nuda]
MSQKIVAVCSNARILLALGVAVSAGVGCGGGQPGPRATRFQGEPPLQIVATTGPVGDAVRHVAGQHGEVTTLMGPGVDPHLYSQERDDMVRLENADVVFYNGLHLEGRLADVLEGLAARRAVFAVTDRLVEENDPRLRQVEGFYGFPDPHVWHDAALWADCVRQVGEDLAEFDPERAADYRKNAADYAAQLDALDAEVREKIASIPPKRRVLVTAHDAFGYFSKTYGMESLGLKGISTEDQVDLARMNEVVNTLVDRDVPCVFVESAVAPKIMEALVEPCEARGHTVRIGEELYADALGRPADGADTYVGMIRANVAAMVDGLRGGEPSEPEEGADAP